MGRFLDLRVSENSSTFGFPNTAIPANPGVPALVGVIGLQTQNIAGSDGLVVHLGGTVGVLSTDFSTIFLNVQRGSTVFGAGTVIYTAEYFHPGDLNRLLITINAEDLAAPAAAETVYSLFISFTAVGIGVVPTRIGPEAFAGIAEDGLAPTP